MSNREDVVTASQRREAVHRALVVLLVTSSALLVFGIIMVYSATAPSSINSRVVTGEGSLFSTANNQLIFGMIGLVLAFIAAMIPLGFYKLFAPVLLIIGLLLQVLIFTRLGVETAGNTNWVKIAGMTFQPSEFLKLALIVFLSACFLYLKKANDNKKKYIILAALVGAALAIGLVIAGRDLGTALVFALIIAGMFWLAGGKTKYLLYVGLLGVLGVTVLVYHTPSRRTRFIDYFSSLFSMPDGVETGQIDYSLWAFGSGGIAGSGIGTSVQKWPKNLPEAQTDFIFAVIGEEFGLAGTLILIVAFLVLGWSFVQIIRYHTNRFGRLVVIGIALWICGQTLGNMLVATGLVPIFGVPLPFISQGGSSLIASLLAIGVTVSSALSIEGVRESFQIRHAIAHKAQAIMSGGK